jgi:hypothetical protein
MLIIRKEPFENGARPPLQTWNEVVPPNGYVFCPSTFKSTFYSTSPAGFVDIEIKGNVVVKMAVNQNALDAFVSSLEEEKAAEMQTVQSGVEAINANHEVLYSTLKNMIANGNTNGMSDKLDIFYATNKITQTEYNELVAMLL